VNEQIHVWERLAQSRAAWDAAMWSEQGQEDRFRAALMRAAPQPGEHVLDWGCGHGALTEWLGKDIVYTGVDWSPAMLAAASRKYHERRFIPPNVWRGKCDVSFAIGTWNLALGWSLADTGAELVGLWDRTLRVLVGSFYAGDDTACIKYGADDLALVAEQLAPRWLIERWRDNDLLLVMRR
jgi:SAM-dependent methyltransferase